MRQKSKAHRVVPSSVSSRREPNRREKSQPTSMDAVSGSQFSRGNPWSRGPRGNWEFYNIFGTSPVARLRRIRSPSAPSVHGLDEKCRRNGQHTKLRSSRRAPPPPRPGNRRLINHPARGGMEVFSGLTSRVERRYSPHSGSLVKVSYIGVSYTALVFSWQEDDVIRLESLYPFEPLSGRDASECGAGGQRGALRGRTRDADLSPARS